MFIRKALQTVIQLLLLLLWAAACSWSPPLSLPTMSGELQPIVVSSIPAGVATPTWTPFQPIENPHAVTSEFTPPSPPAVQPTTTTIPLNTLEATAAPQSARTIWIDPHLPTDFQSSLALPGTMSLVENPEQAEFRLEFNYQYPVSRWTYALVSPFPSLVENISADTLRRAWLGEALGPFAGKPLLMDESSLYALRCLWGEPGNQAVQVLPAEQLLSYAWENNPAWAIVPFESIEPRWKVLEIEGQSPLRKDFDPGMYLLNVPISLGAIYPRLARLSNLSYHPPTVALND